MNKLLVFVFISILIPFKADAVSWERLYSMKSTDCFRHVREVSNGDFIITGYTADFNSTDTNGLVIRMDVNGDTVWTFTYDGPNHREDCFYKGYPTSDGGFIICGYSRSFNGSDNAIYLKLNSSGQLQWVKNWGGTGIDRAQDIVELPNGDFVLVGYSTSSPALYYDAFIMKINASGNTIWSKLYGRNNYDDANSVKLLSDGGFIMGGQSSGNMFLVRTDSYGDSIWTKSFGTSGTDNIECLAISHSGGFIMSGHTNGTGSNGNNGYIVETNALGNILWTRTYGSNDQDDLHYIDLTDDGGYIAVGTSGGGTWSNPNIWILKIDDAGNKDWEKSYGGNSHDHGYAGVQTADGGYIVVGHSHSFANDKFEEDALIVKTNSSGNVSNKLNYTSVTKMVTPVSGMCGNSNVEIKVEISNFGEASVSSIPVTVEITGAITQTLTKTYSSSVDRNETKTLVFSATIDMSAGGTYYFHCYTGNPHDVIPQRNYTDEAVVVTAYPPAPLITHGMHCGPGYVSLSAQSSDLVKWYTGPGGSSSFFTGTNFITPYLTSDTTFYVQAGSACPSARVPITASITSGLIPPAANDQSRCGDGSVLLTANSFHTINWYDSPVGINILHTGIAFNTPLIATNATYYVEAVDSNCTSLRTLVQAIIYPLPVVNLGDDTILVSSGNIDLNAGPGYSNYLWSNSQNSQNITVTADGLHCVTVTDANGCSASDCTFIQFAVGIDNAESEKLISIFATNGIIYLKNPENEKFNFELYSVEGKLIDTAEITGNISELDYGYLSDGYYIACLSNKRHSVKQPVILN